MRIRGQKINNESEIFNIKLNNEKLTLDDFKKINEEELAQSMFFKYSPEFISFSQIKHEDKFYNFYLYWFHDNTFIAFSNDYWEGKVKYYKGGCEHPNFTETKIGNCLHLRECTKCGYKEEIDSSD